MRRLAGPGRELASRGRKSRAGGSPGSRTGGGVDSLSAAHSGGPPRLAQLTSSLILIIKTRFHLPDCLHGLDQLLKCFTSNCSGASPAHVTAQVTVGKNTW